MSDTTIAITALILYLFIHPYVTGLYLGYKRGKSKDFKIESIKKVQLNESDTLIVKVSFELSDEAVCRLMSHISNVTEHKKILILENIDIEVIKKV